MTGVSQCFSSRDVRIDNSLNKHVWSQGVKNVPTRIRVRLSRRRNEDEDAKEKVCIMIRHEFELSFPFLTTVFCCSSYTH